MNYFKARLLGFKRWHLKSNQTNKCIDVHRVSFQSNFTLLNCSGYRISSFLNVFKNFPYLSLLCMQCFLKIHNLGHFSKKSFYTSTASIFIYMNKFMSQKTFFNKFCPWVQSTKIPSKYPKLKHLFRLLCLSVQCTQLQKLRQCNQPSKGVHGPRLAQFQSAWCSV